MTQDELLWTVGKYVRTEDDTRFNCGVAKANESKQHADWHRSPVHGDDADCGPRDKFGAEGLVESVYVDEKDHVWLQFDWGYAIQIFDTTKIMEVASADS